MITQPLPLVNKYRLGWVLFWFLAILLVNATAIGLAESVRGLNSTWMIPFGILAIGLGWMIGGSQRSKLRPFMLGSLIGVLGLVLVSSGAIIHLSRVMNLASPQILPNLYGIKSSLKIDIIVYYLYATVSNFINYYEEISGWLADFLRNLNSFNPLGRDLIWGSLFWVVLFSTGWMFRRKTHAFVASLPAFLLLSSVIGYTRKNTFGLTIALGAILILMVLQSQLIREDRWQKKGFDFSEEIRFDNAVLTIPVVIIILIVASIIPNISLNEIRDFFNEKLVNETENQLDIGESLGLEQNPIESFNVNSSGDMPRSHLIGSGPELSNILVMNIYTNDVFLPPQVTPVTPLPKYYWRGQTYDIYTGGGWKTSPIESESLTAGEQINISSETFNTVLTQKVTKSASASDTLFIAGIPLTVNQRITAGWLESNGEYFSATLPNHVFEVTSQILTISEEAIQDVNEDVPPGILEIYLQIPEDTSERVKQLAESLTEEGITPYSKAKRIESYLRNYEYTLDLPPLPENQDVVDYFLFDLKKGYCDYYASAMVILARSSGLPSRMAVGYATGTYDYIEQAFVITEANAHAWPEVYIAPFGWIPFEPTASLSTFAWLAEEYQLGLMATSTAESIEEMPTTPFWQNLLGVIGLIVIILLLGFLWFWIDHRKQKSKTTSRQIENIYRRMRTLLTRRFFTPKTALTPLEFCNLMIEYLNTYTNAKPIVKLTQGMIKNLSQNLESLTTLYQQGIYTSQQLPSEKIRTAKEHYRFIKIQSWILSIFYQFD